MLDSLIILSHNKLAITRQCLTSVIQDSLFPGATEMIVVDNGSTDGSAEWLEQELPRLAKPHAVAVKVVKNSVNIGCSTARNQGIDLACGTYVTFLDNDVRPLTANWLSGLRSRIDSHSKIGLCGAKMVYPAPPHRIQCAGVGISKRGRVCYRGRGDDRYEPRWNQAEPVQTLISACLMVRRTLLEEHGGFDEAFNPVQFEDFDLVYRLRAAGYEAWYEPAVEMYHDESTTTQGTPSLNNAANVVRNGLLFQKRWRHLFEAENGPPEEDCRWKQIIA